MKRGLAPVVTIGALGAIALAGCVDVDASSTDFCKLRPEVCDSRQYARPKPPGPFDAGFATCAAISPSGINVMGSVGNGTRGVAPLSAVDQPCLGLPDLNTMTVQLRPSDHALLHLSSDGQLRVVQPDALIQDSKGVVSFPTSAVANDDLVATPGCDAGVMEFRVAPDSTLFYACRGNPLAYHRSGSSATLPEGVLEHVGLDGTLLMYSGGWQLVSPTGSQVWLQGSIQSDPALIRATAGGFLTVEGDLWAPELWRLSNDGTYAQAATYPALPDGGLAVSTVGLSSSGELATVFQDATSQRFAIAVRPADGGSAQIVALKPWATDLTQTPPEVVFQPSQLRAVPTP